MQGVIGSEYEAETMWGAGPAWDTGACSGSTALMGDYDDEEDEGVYESDEDEVDHGDPNFFDDEDDAVEDEEQDDDEDL